MANEKRLIYANDYKASLTKWKEDAWKHNERHDAMLIADCLCELEAMPTVDAVEVVQIEKVKREILQTLDTLIATHRDISSSQFSNYEKCLDIPESSNDYYGIKAEAYETARRLVNAALNDLCTNCGAKMDGDGND